MLLVSLTLKFKRAMIIGDQQPLFKVHIIRDKAEQLEFAARKKFEGYTTKLSNRRVKS